VRGRFASSSIPVPKFRSLPVVLVLALAAAGLAGCGKKGPLEPPPGSVQAGKEAKNAPVKGNTFFGPAVEPEQVPIDETEPGRQPLNPQLGVGGTITSAPPSNKPFKPGIAPVGGGSRAKRILPPDKPFILDPLL